MRNKNNLSSMNRPSELGTQALILLSIVITCFFLAIIFWTQHRNQETNLINQVYQRAELCIISVSPTVRTPEYVKSCYLLAEKQVGKTIDHYGDGR
jgi:uncharacterized membrane protein YwzB